VNAETLHQEIESITGKKPERISALSGGSIGQVYRVDFADKTSLVAKVAAGTKAALDIEGYMLGYLADHSRLPIPEVIHSSPTLLLMTFIEGSSYFNAQSQTHAAELLADLHSIRAPQFGLERDTLIGSLYQPNPWTDTWLEFFRDQRLLYMGKVAMDAGQLSRAVFSRLKKFAEQLDGWLLEPEYPSLVHGDVWTTNVLGLNGRITGFIDPAIYYAHPEIELAFTTLFGTFDEPFFQRYHELRPIPPGFFEVRRDIYNLYPLLVHTRLFGGGYAGSVERILRRMGF
jgi:fructosamine-3-kinase